MRYRKKTHEVEAFRVSGCDITIHNEKGDTIAKCGDMIIVLPTGEMQPIPIADFQKFYEIVPEVNLSGRS